MRARGSFGRTAPDEARSKSWDEFTVPGAPKMDLVVTVCDNAAGEVCPIWPGAPSKAHWSFPDPNDPAAFAQVFAAIRAAIDDLAALPVDELDPTTLRRRVAEMGPH